MTPVLSAVYEEVLSRAREEPFSERAHAWVGDFLARTGTFPPDHPEAACRSAAAWEDALCRAGLARALFDALEDPAEKDIAALLVRAHRGLFSFELRPPHHMVHDIISGACFLLLARDSIGREVVGDNLGGLCQARIVAASDGCAMLPGAVFHLPAATAAIENVVESARQREIPVDTLLDGLLKMDFTLRSMSRVHPNFAYRLEALETKPASAKPSWRRRA